MPHVERQLEATGNRTLSIEIARGDCDEEGVCVVSLISKVAKHI